MIATKERKKLAGFTLEGNLSRTQIPINQIELPNYQPRTYFDEEKLEQLTHSIKEYGILEPLIVRPKPFSNLYELVAGGRRYRAAQLANLLEVPVTIKELSDEEVIEIALLENLQREDLNPVEETEGILRLLGSRLALSVEDVPALLYKLNRQHQGQIKSDNNVIIEEVIAKIHQVFEVVGKFTVQSFIQNRLPLLNLPSDILQALKKGNLAYTKARAIAKVENPQQRIELLNSVIRHLQESITQS
jgi:ParB family chromosome partitioning protein